MDTLVPKDHAASSQQLQQSTDINPAVDKGKEAAQPTDKYPQPRVTLQGQDTGATAAAAQPTMPPTNLLLIRVVSRKYPSFDYAKFKNLCEVQGFSNPFAARTESIQFWWVTNWTEGQKLIKTLPYKPNISSKLWKAIAFRSNREHEFNSYWNHINELCLKQNFHAVMSYDEDRRITLVTNRDSTLFDCDMEVEVRNFDISTVKRIKHDTYRATRFDVKWQDGREICINWNKRHCADEKICGRVHACLVCKKTGHNEQKCFKKAGSRKGNPSDTDKAIKNIQQ
ncbi:hypothetical protein C2G38_2306651 [Gigaspora rosea]|uniref:Uncharacterized protein n=1 Tax=Gigaspora rosea TaxID=44941 RepID=A0A397VI93_9GLOM|nr:hypothetical protein C2G38_2306651 [Gigaspora rosea]